MELRRLVDVFVGSVRSLRASGPGGDFYFDFERMTAGEPLEQVVARIGRLADAEGAPPEAPHTFVTELRTRGIRIAIDLPTFSAAFTGRDARLCRRSGTRYLIWFEGLQIRIRDQMLVCAVRGASAPAVADAMPDLLESEESLVTFLAVVRAALRLPGGADDEEGASA